MQAARLLALVLVASKSEAVVMRSPVRTANQRVPHAVWAGWAAHLLHLPPSRHRRLHRRTSSSRHTTGD